MTRWRRTLGLGLALGAVAGSALGLGFGRPPTSATLGQPLDLRIPVRLEAGEGLEPRCLRGEVAFADVPQQPGTISLELEPAPPGATQRVLRLTTTSRVDEPFVTVDLTVGCAAPVSRRFVVFADPPLIDLAAPPVVAAAPEPAARPEAPTALAPSAEPAAPSAPRVEGPTAAGPSADAAPPPPRRRAARPAESSPRIRKAEAPAEARPAQRPRLQLTPLEPGARVAAAPAPAVPTPAELAASAAAAEQTARAEAAEAAASAAQARVTQLESALGALRSDAASTQQAINALQAQLQRSQGNDVSRLVVYLLVALLAVFAGAILWLLRQREQDRQAHAWLAQAAAAPTEAAEPVEDGAAPVLKPSPYPTLNTWVSKPNAVDGFDETRNMTRTSEAGALDGPVGAAGSVAALRDEASRREVAVEELIDLEQQAEFFAVLGQDEAAIELLTGHLDSTAGASPLPYLKLLEIHKRRNERVEYERLREHFNRRFNTYAPGWDTDLQHGRTLEDYGSVIRQLQNLWAIPRRAMEVLQTTLLRAEGDGGVPVESFDLPAYRELMLLYSVARDHAEHEARAVDLLLPLDDQRASQEPTLERLLATSPLTPQPHAQRPLAVDVELDFAPPGSGSART